MPDATHCKVFVSYGRSNAGELADALIETLAANGYQPWRDSREIPAGSPRTESIQQGLEDSQACVAILSPYSVRTFGSTGPGGEARGDSTQGDSICLNEIHAALQLNKPIVPAMAPVRELLQTLVVSQRPLDEGELELLTELHPETQLATALRALSAYVVADQEQGMARYRIFHRSLADWLTKPLRKGALHSVSRALGHARVADRLWAIFDAEPDELGNYGLAYLATHRHRVRRRGHPGAARVRGPARRQQLPGLPQPLPVANLPGRAGAS